MVDKSVIMSLVPLFLFVYHRLFSSYFFMDDFFFLNLTKTQMAKGLLHFFVPVRYIPYRPLSQQFFFFPLFKLFGLNPFPFHIVVLCFHIVNAILVFRILRMITKNKTKAQLLSILYVVSPLHFVGLYSLTGSYIIFGMFHFLVSFWFWLRFEKSSRKLQYILSLVFFILGILSAEIIAVLPVLIWIMSKKKIINRFFLTIPHLVIIFFSLLINIFYAGSPQSGAFRYYPFTFFSSFRWYVLRSFGLPEGIKNGNIVLQTIVLLFFLLFFVMICSGLFLKRTLLFNRLKEKIKYTGWIFIGSLPYILMSQHLNPIYFSSAFIGVLLLFSTFFSKSILTGVVLVYVLLSFFSIQLLSDTHWTVRRSNLSKSLVGGNSNKKVDLFNNVITLYFHSQSDLDEAKVTLQDQLAFRLVYNDGNIKTQYVLD